MSDDTEHKIIESDHYEGERVPVADLLKAIADAVAAMPEEVRDQAFVRLNAYGDYPKAYLVVDRPPTQAEQDAKERERAAREEREEHERKVSEFEYYQRLKAKFGE